VYGEESDHETVSVGILSFTAAPRGENPLIDYTSLPASMPISDPILCTNYHHKAKLESTQLVCKNSRGSDFLELVVNRNGIFEECTHLNSGVEFLEQFAGAPEGSWSSEAMDQANTHSLISPTHIVTSYLPTDRLNPSSHVGVTFVSHKSGILTFPRTVTFSLHKYTSMISMKCISDDYLILVCKAGASNALPEEEIEGHWFGDESENDRPAKSFDIIVFHIPSAKEIYCTDLSYSKALGIGDTNFRLLLDTNSGNRNTAVSICDVGFFVTGESLMFSSSDSHECTTDKSSKKRSKKKKQRLAAKAGKKDAFARGMSMRG